MSESDDKVGSGEALSSPPDKVRHWKTLRFMALVCFFLVFVGSPVALHFWPTLMEITGTYYFAAMSIIFLWATGETLDNRVIPIFKRGK